MEIVDLHEAETHLSQLVEKAAAGEPFVIAKAGKPLVKVVAVDAPREQKRIGFLEGMYEIPDDFDRMFEKEIQEMFEGKE